MFSFLSPPAFICRTHIIRIRHCFYIATVMPKTHAHKMSHNLGHLGKSSVV